MDPTASLNLTLISECKKHVEVIILMMLSECVNIGHVKQGRSIMISSVLANVSKTTAIQSRQLIFYDSTLGHSLGLG